MANKTDLGILFLLLTSLIYTSCTKTGDWDVNAIKTIASDTNWIKKKKLFSNKILPILKKKHNNLLIDYSKCTEADIDEKGYLPLLKGALIREKRIDLLKITTKVETDNLNLFVINQLKMELLKDDSLNKEWITVLILLLPEDMSAIANIRGILCSVLNTNTGVPVKKRLLETIEAAF